MSYLDQLYSLHNQTVLVSGGAGVLGMVMSAGLLRAGARVIVWSRSQNSVDEAIAYLSNREDSEGRVFGYQVDSGNEKQVATALQQAAVDVGPPDILVNAVGGNIGKSAFVETDMQQFNTVLQMNLVAGLMVPTKIVAAYWIEHQIAGAIINLASMTSYNPLSGVWAYNAAKAGVLNLTQAAANEFAPYNIRVNAVAPGFFLGKQNRALLVDESTGEYTPRGKAIIARTPYGRFGEPEELIGAVLFLASNKAAGFVTGISIPVDGGYLAHNI